nr:tRNA-binding protein [uncultured Achromobacter sp.]
MHFTQDPSTPPADPIDFDDFMKVDIRIGTIVTAQAFPEARKPAYKLAIDFGAGVGVKKSSAQITARYALEELTGKRVMAVVNFPPRQIGPMRSEVLVLGFADDAGAIVLAVPDDQVPNGTRLT